MQLAKGHILRQGHEKGRPPLRSDQPIAGWYTAAGGWSMSVRCCRLHSSYLLEKLYGTLLLAKINGF